MVQAGLNPIFVDINREDCNINVNEIEKYIDENTGAILPVHLFGNAANLNQINKLAKKYDLKIVEDVAQSFGSEVAKSSVLLVMLVVFPFFLQKP